MYTLFKIADNIVESAVDCKVKVKLFLCLIECQTMKIWGEVRCSFTHSELCIGWRYVIFIPCS
jgi:hypothetical protein